jgi:hypothetical protein
MEGTYRKARNRGFPVLRVLGYAAIALMRLDMREIFREIVF